MLQGISAARTGKVRVEVNLACIAHNPQKIHRMAGEKMAASA